MTPALEQDLRKEARGLIREQVTARTVAMLKLFLQDLEFNAIHFGYPNYGGQEKSPEEQEVLRDEYRKEHDRLKTLWRLK